MKNFLKLFFGLIVGFTVFHVLGVFIFLKGLRMDVGLLDFIFADYRWAALLFFIIAPSLVVTYIAYWAKTKQTES